MSQLSATSTLRRLPVLLLASGLGIFLGIMGDFAAGDEAISGRDIANALILSPVTVTFGGAAASHLELFFFVGGILFWPGYFVLSWLWIRRVNRWAAVALIFWCWQGFFQVVHRLFMMSSV